jgi:hypothetical protein
MIVGDPGLWSDLFPEHLVPQILDLVWDTWGTLTPPESDEYEVPLTRRFKVALRRQKNFRQLPLRIERESPEDDHTTAAELGRIDLKFTPAGSANEDVYFAFECKRLYAIEKGVRRARAVEYVTEGMARFAGQYAAVMRHGGMIGYVLNGRCEAAIRAVEANFAPHRGSLYMRDPAQFGPSAFRGDNSHIRETVHDFPGRAGFRLHHLFLAGRLDAPSGTEADEPGDGPEEKPPAKSETRKPKLAVILRGPPAIGKTTTTKLLSEKIAPGTCERVDLDAGWGVHEGKRLPPGEGRYSDLKSDADLLVVELACGEPGGGVSGATLNPREWVSILEKEGREIHAFLLWTDLETWRARLLKKAPGGDPGAEAFYDLFTTEGWTSFPKNAGLAELKIETTNIDETAVAEMIWGRLTSQ